MMALADAGSISNGGSVAVTKNGLRKQMRERLAMLTAQEIVESGRRVAKRLLELALYRAAQQVLIYVSADAEIDTHQLIRHALNEKIGVCVPRFDETKECYHPCAIQDFSRDLRRGAYGILEPHPELDGFVSLSDLDIVIVPGLAFTRQGMRLGRGKGYLDRMLQQDHGRVIALAHECQMISSIPSEPHDQAVDIVITPNETIICQEPC